MKFSLISISSLVLFALAASANPLEKRADSATPTASSNITVAATSVAAAVVTSSATSDSMNGAKATASISIIGTPPASGASSMFSYTSMAVIVPAAVAAALSMA